ncbi:MAG: DUF882 domain-containing protein [Gammaproteobacteria bacterium]|nr:DUF882 domain-containing protein [Gammaproteobacteria bacterium]
MLSRRQFLLMATAGCAATLSPAAFANVLPRHERSLRLYNLHTGEKLTTTYWVDGEYVNDELAAVNYLLRDYRNDAIDQIDPRLLDQICLLRHKLDSNGTFHIISGYRSQQTNAWLRRHETGVAKNSLHMQGRAIDLRLPGVDLKHVRKAALAMHAGGVGYYPKSNFVHLDTGRPRFW